MEPFRPATVALSTKAPLRSALVLSLAACSPEAGDNAPEYAVANNSSAMSAPPAMPRAGSHQRSDTRRAVKDLKIGAPAAGQRLAERGAQISETRRTVTSPDHPGAYAIIEDGVVRRISVGQRSDVKLIEGIGVGATEQQWVRDAFPGFRAEPHKYVDAPAKYLTAPNAESGDPALRFEIGEDSTVNLIHVGTVPVLRYVEGCA